MLFIAGFQRQRFQAAGLLVVEGFQLLSQRGTVIASAQRSNQGVGVEREDVHTGMTKPVVAVRQSGVMAGLVLQAALTIPFSRVVAVEIVVQSTAGYIRQHIHEGMGKATSLVGSAPSRVHVVKPLQMATQRQG